MSEILVSLNERIKVSISTLIILVILLLIAFFLVKSIILMVIALLSIIPLVYGLKKLFLKFRNWGKIIEKFENFEVYEKGIYVKLKGIDIFIPWSDIKNISIKDSNVEFELNDGSQIQVKTIYSDRIKELIPKFLTLKS